MAAVRIGESGSTEERESMGGSKAADFLLNQRQAEIVAAWERALERREEAAAAVRESGAATLEALAAWAPSHDERMLRQIVRRPPWGDEASVTPGAVTLLTAFHTALRSLAGDTAAAERAERLVMGLSEAIAEEMTAKEERLAELATADELTGALNRRAVLESLDAEVSRALRHGRGLSVLYLDIDLLKEVNEAHGHAAGDKLLMDVVSVVRRNTRASDRLGRMGGDEFIVVMPDTGRAGAEAAAAKLVRLVSDIGHSVSIGAAGSPQTAPDRQKLLDAADAAMREAKRSGRRQYAVGE